MVRYINRLNSSAGWKWGLVLFALIGWVDYCTGYQVSLVGIYFLAVAFIAWCCGRRAALWAGLIASSLWWGIDYNTNPSYPSLWYGFWNAFMRLVLFSFGGVACAELRRALNEKQEMITQLQQALNQIKTLSGLLPNCASCHRIRSDDGNWETLETYVRDHAQIEFIQSVCPDCAKAEFAIPAGKK